ncbi:MAG: hypothetical protein KGK12_09740, partial [Armatimonadetes bacterium]|nr:hypothetical protein [Armatimonadota bacterium]
MRITSRAPVRIDFAGGWTDVGIFAHGAGGAVLNAAINHYVRGTLETVDTDVDDGMQPSASQHDLSVDYHCDLPSGSGLGTSSALNVVWLSLVKSNIVTDADRAQIAELAYQLEEMLGILGGKQDQYASAYGGFNFMTFTDTVEVERLTLPPAVVEALEDRLVLCYTGKPRLSGNIHEHVWGAFRRGAAETVSALYTLRACANEMRQALPAGDIEEFGRLLNRNWAAQKQLDSSVTNQQMEELFGLAHVSGAAAGKACG